jgi:hypothetical protein
MKHKTATKHGYLAFLSCSAILPAALTARQAATDPFIWLEDVDGTRSMDWVNAHNASRVVVTNEQSAKSLALTYAYLWRRLGGSPGL